MTKQGHVASDFHYNRDQFSAMSAMCDQNIHNLSLALCLLWHVAYQIHLECIKCVWKHVG